MDFSGLLTLAVGFNAVYVIAKSKSDDTRPFFLMLDKISGFTKKTARIISAVKCMILKMSDIEPEITFSESFEKLMAYKENFFKEDSLKKYKNIINRKSLKKRQRKINTIEKRCASLPNSNNLYKVACISLFYSLYVLISAAYEYRCDMELNESLIIPNIFIPLLALICILEDWSRIRKIYLNMSILVLAVMSIVGILAVLLEHINMPFTIKYNHIYTIVTCFVAFLFYLIAAIMGYPLSLWYRLRVVLIFRKNKKDIKAYKVAREQIDEKLKMDRKILTEFAAELDKIIPSRKT
ncbi:MAG: hypothetical protein LBL90_07590 [Prevotellaceae bacterium]|nr:hypothetical protein [Prevotellaceae bacterium]